MSELWQHRALDRAAFIRSRAADPPARDGAGDRLCGTIDHPMLGLGPLV